MKTKNNCYVVVNCGDNPCFGGQYETPEDVYAAYEKYPTFTARVFSSLRAANKERDALDQNVAIDRYADCLAEAKHLLSKEI